MHVYIFSSSTLTNIWAGIGARKWAVSNGQGANASIRGKAANLPVGAFGLLYCVDLQSLTTPFLITSRPDMNASVGNVWLDEWVLPFSIFPLGSPRHQIQKDDLANLLPSLKGGRPWTQLIHFQPITAFAPSDLSDDDWAAIAAELVES